MVSSVESGGRIDDVDALAQHVELAVGDDDGDLDQRVALRSRPVISQSIHTNRSFMGQL